jgi:integrase
MASLERRNQTYRVVFMYAGRKYSYSLDTGDRDMAEALRGGVEKTLMLLDQKLLHLPEGANLVDFIRSGGQVEAPAPPVVERLALTALKQRYLEAHGQGALEPNSLSTMAMHLGHFENTLGARFTVQDLTLADLQRHVNARAQKKYRGRKLSPVTLKKEIASLRAAWNWSAHLGLVHGTFPNKGLVYPKTDEKPPFMTWPEIERKLAGLPEREQQPLWECLFLTQPEVAELLEHVKVAATHPWIYPALVFVAHPGVRRSEMLRVKVQDLDLVAGSALIREKKRTRGRRTHRRVPLSTLLATVLRDWMTVHPGGPYRNRSHPAADFSAGGLPRSCTLPTTAAWLWRSRKT